MLQLNYNFFFFNFLSCLYYCFYGLKYVIIIAFSTFPGSRILRNIFKLFLNVLNMDLRQFNYILNLLAGILLNDVFVFFRNRLQIRIEEMHWSNWSEGWRRNILKKYKLIVIEKGSTVSHKFIFILILWVLVNIQPSLIYYLRWFTWWHRTLAYQEATKNLWISFFIVRS